MRSAHSSTRCSRRCWTTQRTTTSRCSRCASTPRTRSPAPMADAIGFGELVGLMVLGKGEVDVLRGEIHTVEGDVERRYRLWRRGNLSREEDQDGTVLEIVGVDGRWHRDVDTGEVWMRPHERRVDTLHAH